MSRIDYQLEVLFRTGDCIRWDSLDGGGPRWYVALCDNVNVQPGTDGGTVWKLLPPGWMK